MSIEQHVDHPPHYQWLPNGVEVIDITELFGFRLGNVLKYILRHEHKGKPLEDLKKARFYLDREIAALEQYSVQANSPQTVRFSGLVVHDWKTLAELPFGTRVQDAEGDYAVVRGSKITYGHLGSMRFNVQGLHHGCYPFRVLE